MRFTHPELQAFRGIDVARPGRAGGEVAVRRFQSGLRTVAVQAHFPSRGNRFYPALQQLPLRVATHPAGSVIALNGGNAAMAALEGVGVAT